MLSRIACHRIASGRKCLLYQSTLRTALSTGTNVCVDDAEEIKALRSAAVPPRRKKLASVIREGIFALNEIASAIQSNPKTKKRLLARQEKEGPSDRQREESFRVLEAANECMEELSAKDHDLSVRGEPILLLDIDVKRSIKVATLYWALPYSVLLDEHMPSAHKEELQRHIARTIETKGLSMLQRSVSSRLSHYYPPKLRLMPAPPMMILQALHEVMGD